MSENTGVPFESGVDWITCTALDPHNANLLEARALRLLRKAERSGEEKHPWAMSGFAGECCAGVQMGYREHSVICRLSGETAHENWRVVHDASDNTSRLDVQVTVRFECEVQPLIHRHFKEASAFSRKQARGPKVSVYSSSDDSTTLYLGDRSSDKFGRCYNKAKESKLDHYIKSLRYEVELKNDTARLCARQLSVDSNPRLWVRRFVFTFFSKRGCRLNWASDGTETLCVPRSRSTVIKQLDWLRSNVRGSVQFLKERGYEREVLEALGLDHGC
jgi:hypothetical protein